MGLFIAALVGVTVYMPSQTCTAGARGADGVPVLTNCPPDVRPLVERALMCAHWQGEEPYDAARGKEIAAAVKKLRCDTVEADQTAILEKYKKSPTILHVLKQSLQF